MGEGRRGLPLSKLLLHKTSECQCAYAHTKHAMRRINENFDTDIRDHRLPTDRTGRDAQLGERPTLRCGAFLSAVPFDPYYWEILADQDEVIRLTVTLAGHYWIISPGR